MKSSQNLKNMAVVQPRPTQILYQCAKCGDDRTSFNVICDVCGATIQWRISKTGLFFQMKEAKK